AHRRPPRPLARPLPGKTAASRCDQIRQRIAAFTPVPVPLSSNSAITTNRTDRAGVGGCAGDWTPARLAGVGHVTDVIRCPRADVGLDAACYKGCAQCSTDFRTL